VETVTKEFQSLIKDANAAHYYFNKGNVLKTLNILADVVGRSVHLRDNLKALYRETVEVSGGDA